MSPNRNETHVSNGAGIVKSRQARNVLGRQVGRPSAERAFQSNQETPATSGRSPVMILRDRPCRIIPDSEAYMTSLMRALSNARHR